MILTVTLNPAWDVTYRLPGLTPGEVHRVQQVSRRPGGKGVNVASVLAQLGVEVIAGGYADEPFAQAVLPLGVLDAFERVLPEVRSTLVVVEDDRTTSLWEPGVAPTDPARAEEGLLATVGELLPTVTAVVVSGSLPPGVTPDLPARLAALTCAAGVPALVDSSGAALAAAVAVPGAVVLPNASELTELAGPTTTTAQVVAASGRLVAGGLSAVFATRGRDGIVVTTAEGAWRVPAPGSLRGNPTGAGDAAAAAIACALAAGATPVEAAADAVALAATAVAAPVAGIVDPALFERLRPTVTPTSLS